MSAALRLRFGLGLCLALLLPVAARAADEPEKPWKIDTAVAFNSDYMFRGQNLYDGISIQPSAGVSYDTGFGTVGASIWMHTSAEGDRQEEKFFELDKTISYAYDFDKLSFKTGFLWYFYPDSSDDINDTSEYYVGLSYDDSEVSPFALNPSLTYYKDYREYDTSYFELTFSHAIETDALGKGFNTTPYVTFGFCGNSDKIYADDGLEFVAIGTSFNLTLGDIAVVPTINYSFKVDDNTVNEFWVGFTLGYTI
ncbi:MAG: TorF family putative porin [Bdellovibrionota bacterium]